MSNPSSFAARSPRQKYRKFHLPPDLVEENEEQEKDEKKGKELLSVHPLLGCGELEEDVRMRRMELQKED